MQTGLIVSHSGSNCGVYQFGRNLFEVLSKNKEILWHYCECSNEDELESSIRRVQPNLILFNYTHSTMPWLLAVPVRQYGALLFCLLHNVDQDMADRLIPDPFDFLVCLDPTIIPRNPCLLRAPRFAPVMMDQDVPAPEVFTIGSFGFATRAKGFERLCALVCAQFDRAIIRLNIPKHDDPNIVSETDWQATVDGCRKAIVKPGVDLVVTSHFFENRDLIQFLASNTLNAFLYEMGPATNGVSSCVDHALASGRPFALTRSPMFRNFSGFNPSIFVEDRSLADIAQSDMSVFEAARHALTPEHAAQVWTREILQAVAAKEASESTPDGRGFNKMLDDRSRIAYRHELADLEKYAPQIIDQRPSQANIREAFALHKARRVLAERPNGRILAVISQDNAAVQTLQANGYAVDRVAADPRGAMLEDFYIAGPVPLNSYDLILCIGELEHIENDVRFIRILSEFLRPGGVVISVIDFSEAWQPGQPLPQSDYRLYTTDYIRSRIMPAIPDCMAIDLPRWQDGEEDFFFENCKYGFAGFVFRKLDEESVRSVNAPPLWRELLAERSTRRVQL